MSGKVVSKGRRQRSHQVKVISDEIYVKVDTEELSKQKLASDCYVSLNGCIVAYRKAYKELYKVKRGNNSGPIHSTK